MPGGQLPWDTDVDAPHYAKDFYDVVEKVVPELQKYGHRLEKRKKCYSQGLCEAGGKI